jgi:hypothetical protein
VVGNSLGTSYPGGYPFGSLYARPLFDADDPLSDEESNLSGCVLYTVLLKGLRMLKTDKDKLGIPGPPKDYKDDALKGQARAGAALRLSCFHPESGRPSTLRNMCRGAAAPAYIINGFPALARTMNEWSQRASWSTLAAMCHYSPEPCMHCPATRCCLELGCSAADRAAAADELKLVAPRCDEAQKAGATRIYSLITGYASRQEATSSKAWAKSVLVMPKLEDLTKFISTLREAA